MTYCRIDNKQSSSEHSLDDPGLSVVRRGLGSQQLIALLEPTGNSAGALKVDSAAADGDRLTCDVVAKIRDKKLHDLGDIVWLCQTTQWYV